jgi:CubicO group peptidase (beta-lactamase class C family)
MRPSKVLIAFSCLAGCAFAASADPIDDYVRAEMASRGVPGLALAVVRGERVVKESAYGVADLELKVPATTKTVFQLASATKPFTGVAVALLVDDGKLAFDRPIGTILPDLPAAWREVTVRQLMNHTSGLPDVFADKEAGTMRAEGRDALLAALYAAPVDNPPGTVWAYDQTGYLLIGMIVEKVSGLRYEEFVAKRILQPLGMSSSTFGDYFDVVPGRAAYYRPDDTGRLRHYLFPFPTFLHTAAGLNTTLGDLRRFLDAVWSGRLISAGSRAAMLEPARLADGTTHDYACGWVGYKIAGKTAWGHSGGGTAAFATFPDDDLSVIVFGNLSPYDPESLLSGIAERVRNGRLRR